MVTGTVADSTVSDLFANDRTTDPDPEQFPDILEGRYQLEVRRTESEYIFSVDPNDPDGRAIRGRRPLTQTNATSMNRLALPMHDRFTCRSQPRTCPGRVHHRFELSLRTHRSAESMSSPERPRQMETSPTRDQRSISRS